MDRGGPAGGLALCAWWKWHSPALFAVPGSPPYCVSGSHDPLAGTRGGQHRKLYPALLACLRVPVSLAATRDGGGVGRMGGEGKKKTHKKPTASKQFRSCSGQTPGLLWDDSMTRLGSGSLGCRKIMWNLCGFFPGVLALLNDFVFCVITLGILAVGFSKAGVYGEDGAGWGMGEGKRRMGPEWPHSPSSSFRIQFLSQEQGANSRGSSGLTGLELSPCLLVTKEEMPFHLSRGPCVPRPFSITALWLPHLFGICLFAFFFWVIHWGYVGYDSTKPHQISVFHTQLLSGDLGFLCWRGAFFLSAPLPAPAGLGSSPSQGVCKASWLSRQSQGALSSVVRGSVLCSLVLLPRGSLSAGSPGALLVGRQGFGSPCIQSPPRGASPCLLMNADLSRPSYDLFKLKGMGSCRPHFPLCPGQIITG